jgi:hypothetical protein
VIKKCLMNKPKIHEINGKVHFAYFVTLLYLISKDDSFTKIKQKIHLISYS